MQDNEFEKQVHDKLVGMQMDTSDAVWQEVQHRLDEKNKRRRWILWFPLGAAGLVLIAFFLLNKGQTTGSPETLSAKPHQSTTGKKDRRLPSVQHTPSSNNTENRLATSGEDSISTSTAISAATEAHASTAEAPTKAKIARTPPQTSIAKRGDSHRNRKLNAIEPSVGMHPAEADDSDATELSITEPTRSPREPQASRISSALLSDINFSTAASLLTYPLPAAVAPPSSLAQTEPRWRWGFALSGGKSGISSGKFEQLFSSDAPSSNNYSSGNLGNSFGNGPSPVKAGVSYSVGGFVTRQIEPAIYFRGGLQFSLHTTTIMVGNRREQPVLLQSANSRADKSIEAYYTTENNRRYVNRYSYLDIPLALGFNLIRNTRMPVAWEIGFSPSQFITSNALHYSNGSRIYYKDNSIFKKLQFQYFTSLPITLYSGKAYALTLAPSIRYNTSDLFKPETDARKHFFIAHVGLRFDLKK